MVAGLTITAQGHLGKMANACQDKVWDGIGRLSLRHLIEISGIASDMRAILIGAGQLNLFRSLEDAFGYVEGPEAENDDLAIYVENWDKYSLLIGRDSHSKSSEPTVHLELTATGGDSQENFISDLHGFLSNAGIQDFEYSSDSIFDEIEIRWGFT